MGFSLSYSHGRTNTGDWDSNESPVTPAGPTLRRTSSFLYLTLNVIWKAPSNFRNVCFQHVPSVRFLGPLPRRGGVPLPPRRMDKPSAAFAAASRALITFCDAISAPSLPGVPTRSVANATCTAWGHHWLPEHSSKGQAIILLDPALKTILTCTIADQNNGQWFNQFAMDANCSLVPLNPLLPFLRHRNAKRVLTSYSK